MLSELFDLIHELQDIRTLLFYVPPSIIFIVVIAYLAGYLKLKRRIKTNYTRKIFHIGIFCFAGVIALYGTFAGVLIYGGIAAVFIIVVLILGERNVFYEGIAREEDHPHRSRYILLPLVATMIGGLLGRSLFGGFAVIGYFIVGLGDAAGEPIGVRFGSHTYNVPSLTGVRFYRSIEGSIAVFAASTLTSFFILLYLLDVPAPAAAVAGLAIGAIACAVEAISPHGLDNFTVQFFPLIGGYLIVQVL